MYHSSLALILGDFMLWMGSSAKLFAASAERDSRNGMTAVRGELRRNS